MLIIHNALGFETERNCSKSSHPSCGVFTFTQQGHEQTQQAVSLSGLHALAHSCNAV